ncbi:MAG TPA: hypothetical protein VMJ70_11080 [Candidatus Sulfotelmatobacter sp.]|nr:hypothetical protein [Candidatus Sulfotelmatobacter sp.]
MSASSSSSAAPAPSASRAGGPLSWWPWPILIAAGLVHLLAILTWINLAIHRYRHPLELGNVEGMLMDSIVRLAHGQPLFGPPVLDFIPLAYMPGFFIVVAPLVKIFGPFLWVPRLVSVIETLVLAAAIARYVWLDTRSLVLAIAGAGIMIGGFGFAAGCYDLVGPNAQFMMFAIAGMLALRETRGAAGAILAGVLIGASFLSKQHGLLFGLMALPYLLFFDRRRLVPFAVALAAAAGGGYALMTLWFGKWFPFYTYDVPSHWSTLSFVRIQNYIGKDVFGTWGVCSVPAVLAIVPAWREGDRRVLLAWSAWGGGLAAGLLATLDPYAYRHTLMPVVVSLALLAPIAAQRILRAAFAGGTSASATTERAVTAIAALLLVLQYPAVAYSARRYLPPPHAEETRAAFYARLKAIPGPVLMPYHGFYTWEALGKTSFHLLALDDIVRAHGNRLLRTDPQLLDRMFDGLRHGPNRPWLVLDLPLERTGDVSLPMWQSLAPHYRLVDSLGVITEGLRPVAGLRDAPSLIYQPIGE